MSELIYGGDRRSWSPRNSGSLAGAVCGNLIASAVAPVSGGLRTVSSCFCGLGSL